MLTDPGYIINKDIEFMKLLELFDSASLCAECHTIKTLRSRHCIICHSCVDRYDHHCPWINNCVGIRNHNLFMWYLFFQLFTLFISIAQTFYIITLFIKNEQECVENDNLIFEVYYEYFDLLLSDRYVVKKSCLMIGLIIIELICVFFTIPLIRLLSVQVLNFFHGKTTNERFGRIGAGN